MMADKLTDDQLRKALIELGEVNIGAVTASTRPIYLKKLNHLRARQKQSANARGSKSTNKKLLGFSSDESENDEKVQPAASGGRRRVSTSRQTTKRAPPNQTLLATNTRQDSRGPNVSNNKSVNKPGDSRSSGVGLARPALRTRQSNRRPAAVASSSTSQNVSRDNVDNSTHVPRRSSRMNRTLNESNNVSRGPLNFSKFTDSVGLQVSIADDSQDSEDDFGMLDDIPDNFESSDSDLDVRKVPDFANSGTSSPEYVNKGMNTSFPMIDSSYMSPDTSYTRPAASAGVSPMSSSSFYGSTNPVLRTKGSKAANSVTRRTPVNEQQPVHNYVQVPKKSPTQVHPFKVEEGSWGNSVAHYISMFLVILFALFFVFIGIMYWNMRQTSSQDHQLDHSDWMPCNDKDPDKTPCLKAEEMSGVKSIIQDLGTMLDRRSGDFECGNVDSGNMTIKQIEDKLQLNTDDKRHLRNAMMLIRENKQWMIRLLTNKGREANTDAGVYGMVSESPSLSLWCRLSRALSKVFGILFILVIVALVISAVLSLIRWYWKRQEEESRNVYNMVERIIDILKNHSDDCQDNSELQPYMAIPHVRDMLIPPKERRMKQVLWDKAVKFLSANESRVRVEMKTIQGEEFAVWRWLQACPNGSKVWQGQAFGENQDAGGPRYSLSSCLKIRNMFDLDVEYGNDWHVYIQDALIEKCGPKHSILHIAVDKSSTEGCVYIKFLDDHAAGRAYKLLHGWWFDGNLVTVKYLRLERYHERFPDSISCRSPLTASNNEKLSLSQPFYHSIMEKS